MFQKMLRMTGRYRRYYVHPYNWDPMEPFDGLLERHEKVGDII